jgi:hypothetical protein
MRAIYLLFAVLLPVAASCQQIQIGNLGIVYMSVPGVKGFLQLEVGSTSWQSRVRPDGIETQMQAMNRKDGLLITAFLQKVNFDASAEKCRSEWWSGTEKGFKKNGVKIQDLQLSNQGDAALVEFIAPEFKGKDVHQKSVHAYFGSRDLCAEVHMSKMDFKDEDRKLFEDVLFTVKLQPDATTPRSASGPSAAEKAAIAQASRFYLQHNYEMAANLYQLVLDMEQQRPSLDETMFRVLVDNLGMSYGLTGKLDKAKETFEYGITQQPEYPLFYYNMACTYAEKGKKNEALEQLRLFYQKKANMIAGESPPDPLKDDSFRKLVKDHDFVSSVQGMQK